MQTERYLGLLQGCALALLLLLLLKEWLSIRLILLPLLLGAKRLCTHTAAVVAVTAAVAV
jgi:hypothetical protein